MKRILQIILLISVIGLSVLVGSLIGPNSKKMDGEIVSELIAVVNMDKGYVKNEVVSNYGSKLFNNEESFHYTGISEAKEGLRSGKYAAYLIVPESFSQQIESLNTNPKSARLQFEIADNLNYASKERVLTNIYELEADVNYEISYMYLSALMDELYAGQGIASKTIVQNGEVMTKIDSIETEKMIEEFNKVESPQIEELILNIDMTQEKGRLEKELELLRELYDKTKNAVSMDVGNVAKEYNELKQDIIYQQSGAANKVNEVSDKSKQALKDQEEITTHLLNTASEKQIELFEELGSQYDVDLSQLIDNVSLSSSEYLEQTYLKGYKEGRSGGYALGYQRASNKYYLDGHNDGYEYGFAEGYKEAHPASFRDGYEVGFDVAKSHTKDIICKEYEDIDVVFSLSSLGTLSISNAELQQAIEESKIFQDYSQLISYLQQGYVVIEDMNQVDNTCRKLPIHMIELDDSEMPIIEEESLAPDTIKQPQEDLTIDEDEFIENDLDIDKIKVDEQLVTKVIEELASSINLMSDWFSINASRLTDMFYDNQSGESLQETIENNNKELIQEIDKIPKDLSEISTESMNEKMDKLIALESIEVSKLDMDRSHIAMDEILKDIEHTILDIKTFASTKISKDELIMQEYGDNIEKQVEHYQASQATRISEAISEVQEQSIRILEENIGSLNEHVSKLQHTQKDEQLNSTFKDHLLRSIEVDVNSKQQMSGLDEAETPIVLITIFAVVLLLSSCLLILKYRKKYQKNEL